MQRAAFFTFAFSLAFSLSLAANSHGQTPTVSPGPGAILLRHGDIIEGNMQPRGDQVTIEQNGNTRFSIPMRNVEWAGKNKQEIYQFLISRFTRVGTGEHVQMTKWCLKHRMVDEAIYHWRFVKRDLPESPTLKQLSIQLRETILQEPWAQQALAQTNKEPEKDPSGVSTAEYSKSTSSGGSAGNSQVVTAQAESDALNVSAESIQKFRSEIQPILIQRCAQSGCHGTQSNNAPILARPTDRNTKKIGEQNVRSVIPYIRTADPIASPLLVMALTPHGNQKQASLGPADSELRLRMQEWIRLTAAQPIQVASINTPNSANRTATATQPPAGQTGGTVPGILPWQQQAQSTGSTLGAAGALASRPSANDAPVFQVQNFNGPINNPATMNLGAEITPQALIDLEREIERAERAEQGLPAAPPTVADPFDPASFNQQYHKNPK